MNRSLSYVVASAGLSLWACGVGEIGNRTADARPGDTVCLGDAYACHGDDEWRGDAGRGDPPGEEGVGRGDARGDGLSGGDSVQGGDVTEPPSCTDVVCGAHAHCELIASAPQCVCDRGYVDHGGTCVPSCVPSHEICNNGRDDDCDNLSDCDDPGCSSHWGELPDTGTCVPKCVQTGTCDYGVFEESTLNVMALGMLSAQKISHENDGHFGFAVISDPHITDDPGINNEAQAEGYSGSVISKENPFNQSYLHSILEALSAPEHHAAFVVITGDLVDIGENADYEQYANGVAAFMRRTSIPVFSVLGNHDMWDYWASDASCIFLALSKCGDPDFHFEFEGSRFVISNDANYAIHASTGALASLDSLYEAHAGSPSSLQSALASYRVSIYSDSSPPRWRIFDDQLDVVEAALAQTGVYHFGFTHLPVSRNWPAGDHQDDIDTQQYRAYEGLFAGKAGHAVFSGHSHVLGTYVLGSSGPAANYVLDDAYHGGWAWVTVSPTRAQIQHSRCDSNGNNCFTPVGDPLNLAP